MERTVISDPPGDTLPPCPWHGISSTTIMTLTGRSRWQLARDRMDGQGLPFFKRGIYKGNKTYYLAAAVLEPDLPFWQACRSHLVAHDLIDIDAGIEATWITLNHWQLKAPSMFPSTGVTTAPRRPTLLLENIERAYRLSAHNSSPTGELP